MVVVLGTPLFLKHAINRFTVGNNSFIANANVMRWFFSKLFKLAINFRRRFYKGFLFLVSCSANPIRSPSGPRM